MLPVLVAILALGAACVAWGIWVERSWYRVDRHRLAILPADAPGPVTVLHLSDLHFVRRDPKKAAFLAALPPADVTIVTGDFLAEPEAVETAVAGVRAVRGSAGSWFVLGSNDYYAPRPLNYLAYFRRSRKRRWVTKGRPEDLREQLRAEVRGAARRSWRPMCASSSPRSSIGTAPSSATRREFVRSSHPSARSCSRRSSGRPLVTPRRFRDRRK